MDSSTICVINACCKPAIKKGLCSAHYHRLRRHGSPTAGRAMRKPSYPKTCTEDGCENGHYGHGFCRHHHYRNIVAPRRPVPQYINSGKVCSVDGCDSGASSRGFCIAHYERFLRWGDPLGSRGPKKVGVGTQCSIQGCDNPVKARGWCNRHWAQWQRKGDPEFKSDWTVKRSQPIIDANGYVLVPANGHPNAARGTNQVRIAEHRLVMSEMLGRPLLPGENVHHINGDKTDNRPENLELWVSSQPAGQRPADLVKWAREIIRRYGDMP